MDKSSIIGLVVGIIAIFIGMILKGIHPSSLNNMAAILIIILGTMASVTIAFPTNELKKVPALFKILFSEQKMMNMADVIKTFSNWARISRSEGILALERELENIEDKFLKDGMEMAIDGKSPDYIRDVLLAEIELMEERHKGGAQIFSQAGTYAPTLGVLGAVVGLIAALSDISDTEQLGYAISSAFVATLLGIFTGYVLWNPFANKLRRKSKQEAELKMLMIEGIISIIEGENPKSIEKKLSYFLPADERVKFLNEREESKNEQE